MLDVVRVLQETFVARAELMPTVDSTNEQAMRCAARGVLESPLLIATEEQTAGRGRGGHRWWTGRGALAFSLLVDPAVVAADEKRSPLAALASAVAVAETVAALLPDRTVGIHWPNDVLADGRKMAGILIEVLADRRHVIGIGLNLNNTVADAPAELKNTVGTVFDLAGRRFEPTEVLIKLLRHLEREFSLLRDAPDRVAAKADAMCLDRNRTVTLQWNDRATTGRCRGIAADGAIQLETSTGVEAFYSGSISPQV